MFNISAGVGGSPNVTATGKPIVTSVKSTFSSSSGKIPTRAIPPSGTSARKAYEKTMREGSGAPRTTKERLTGTYNYPAKPIVSKVVDTVKPHTSNTSTSHKRSSGGSSGSHSSGSSGSSPTTAKEAFDYYEAPISKKYGFNKTTAYQEALANTAYRREMEDMRKAGLNPSVIYGSHNTSGAYSHIYPEVDPPASSNGNHSSGGSGGSGRRYGRGNSGKYLFSGSAYYGIMAAAGVATAAITHNVGAGMAAAGLAGTAMKALNGLRR